MMDTMRHSYPDRHITPEKVIYGLQQLLIKPTYIMCKQSISQIHNHDNIYNQVLVCQRVTTLRNLLV